jgi:hypothetical protein
MLLKRFVRAALPIAGALAFAAHLNEAHAAAGQGFSLTCANGKSFQIRPLAVSDEGDLVTGYLMVRRHRGIAIRLVPMGQGYRYAGRGLWFDGVEGHAVLNWGTRSATPCTVERG